MYVYIALIKLLLKLLIKLLIELLLKLLRGLLRLIQKYVILKKNFDTLKMIIKLYLFYNN